MDCDDLQNGARFLNAVLLCEWSSKFAAEESCYYDIVERHL